MDELTIQDLRDAFAEKARGKGFEVIGTGHGYSGGTYFDMVVKTPTGLQIAVWLEESKAEDYLVERYGEEQA